jgi:hypothetical protein
MDTSLIAQINSTKKVGKERALSQLRFFISIPVLNQVPRHKDVSLT